MDLDQITSYHPGYLMYFFFILCTMPASKTTIILCYFVLDFSFFVFICRWVCFSRYLNFSAFMSHCLRMGEEDGGTANEEIVSEN